MLHKYKNQSNDLQSKSTDWFLYECNISQKSIFFTYIKLLNIFTWQWKLKIRKQIIIKYARTISMKFQKDIVYLCFTKSPTQKRVPIQVFFIKTNLYNRFFLITFRISSIENKTNFSKIFQGEIHSTRLPLKSFHVGA